MPAIPSIPKKIAEEALEMNKLENTRLFKFLSFLNEEARSYDLVEIRTKTIGKELLISIYDMIEVIRDADYDLDYAEKCLTRILEKAKADSEIFKCGVQYIKFKDDDKPTPVTSLKGIMFIITYLLISEEDFAASVGPKRFVAEMAQDCLMSCMMGDLSLISEVNILHKMKQELNDRQLWSYLME